jgi:hypothetical protein
MNELATSCNRLDVALELFLEKSGISKSALDSFHVGFYLKKSFISIFL